MKNPHELLVEEFQAALAAWARPDCDDCFGRGWIKRHAEAVSKAKRAESTAILMPCGCTRRHSNKGRRDPATLAALAPSEFDLMIQSFIERQKQLAAERPRKEKQA